MTTMLPNLLTARRRQSLAGMTLLGVGIVLALWAANAYRELSALNTATADIQAIHTNLKRERDRLRTTPPKQTAERDIAGRQARPLVPKLAWLEQTWSGDIAYVRIDVNGAANTLRLDVEARDDDALLALLDTLSALPDATAASLVRQRRSDVGIEATLQLRWRETSR